MNCILCEGSTKEFWKSKNREFVECTNCGGIQLLPQYYISKKAEEERYLTHNNDVEDRGYQDFVSPITSRILKDFSTKHSGLDYGCGTGPVAANILEKQGYYIALFDPFFYPNTKVLNTTYDFIICCEVMEHLYEPKREFSELAARLNPNGKLYCKTSIYSKETDFDNWYYKNDRTHVFFYTAKSLKWIKNNLGFKTLKIEPKLILFSK
ncbi:class I SAM-dependent methyltransferase [Salegentibacter salegens]|uniref:Methyltransferase domain-containing protein n=1 Tax=Salegentibacter salegens TaxID=143223 RepID=A0A1M7KE69_9FLAO|nr:class I SAM-dependent methyltransferase [Salegentibacter salegens]PRX49614.1 methyltransferase family protein [Salegentibacter salegens]SHM63540.1 Methyltransferase domain-containing protein [Salegentibacter salegens]